MLSMKKELGKNKRYRRTLSGKALFSTLIICVVILTIVSIFTMAVRAKFEILAKSESELITFLTNNSCISLLSSKYAEEYNSKICLDTVINLNNRMTYCKSIKWGLFKVVSCKSCSIIDTVEHSNLVGFKQHESFDSTALILTNDRDIVSLGGNTSIRAKVYLPFGRVERKNFIESSETSRSEREGLIHSSKEIETSKLINHNDNQVEFPTLESFNCGNNLIYYNDLEKIEMNNSFNNATDVIFSHGTIEISDARLRGNIVVFSMTNIILSNSNEVSDVLFVSPSIIVEKGFKGNVHFVVRDSVVIEDSCHFLYPSSILFKPTNSGELRFGQYCKFEGAISAIKAINHFAPVQIDLGVKNEFSGSIYSEFPFYASGLFNGLVITPGFGYKSEKTINNHLNNVKLLHTFNLGYYASGINTNNGYSIAKILE